MATTRTGHINLFGVYEFVATHPELVRESKMKPYSDFAKGLVKAIPHASGWYLWGRFNDVGWWETIYLGLADKRKTASLRARILEELKDELVAFWATVYGYEPT